MRIGPVRAAEDEGFAGEYPSEDGAGESGPHIDCWYYELLKQLGSI
jgi:hypothetical protein